MTRFSCPHSLIASTFGFIFSLSISISPHLPISLFFPFTTFFFPLSFLRSRIPSGLSPLAFYFRTNPPPPSIHDIIAAITGTLTSLQCPSTHLYLSIAHRAHRNITFTLCILLHRALRPYRIVSHRIASHRACQLCFTTISPVLPPPLLPPPPPLHRYIVTSFRSMHAIPLPLIRHYIPTQGTA